MTNSITENYLTVPQTAKRWGVSRARVSLWAKQGRIAGVEKFGRVYLIPRDADPPDPDPRWKHQSTVKKKRGRRRKAADNKPEST